MEGNFTPFQNKNYVIIKLRLHKKLLSQNSPKVKKIENLENIFNIESQSIQRAR